MSKDGWVRSDGFWIKRLIIGVAALFFLFVVIAFICSTKYAAKLNAQCLADGRTEYECYAMIYGRGR